MKPVSPVQQFRFAARLAWRQMIFSRAKLLAAVLGVMFACVLVYMQTGFRDALYASVVLAPSKIDGDLFLIHRQTEAFWRTIPFARAELYRAMAHPDVKEVVPLYMGMAPFKNPVDHTKRTLTLYGYDPLTHLMKLPQVIDQHDRIIDSDTGLFDEASRPEFGPIAQLLSRGPVLTEINDRSINLKGTFRLGGSFASDGNVIVSDNNFFRIFAGRVPEQIDLGVIRLKAGVDPLKVQKTLGQRVSKDVYLFTFAEMQQHEFQYWQKNVPVGFIFGFGTLMGLVVGMIIVYQILFTDISTHMNQYATLTAMGYTFQYLLMVVLASSLILAVLGFVPGTLLAWVLYRVVEVNIFLPMPMPLVKMLSIFAMILVMCVMSGVLAMQKLRSVDPADMF
jgi:putative ABC transport system permease protein